MFHLGVGELASADSASVASALELYRTVPEEGAIVTEREHIFLRLAEFGIAVSDSGHAPIDASRRYLLEAFLENAALAIRNSRMRQELARRERLATVGQALGYVIHDLNAPLASIDLMARLLELNSSTLGPHHEVYGSIRRATMRARAVIQDTLDFCRDGLNVTRALISLGDELREQVEVWRLMLAEQGTRLEATIEPELRGYVDLSTFGRALWNLLSNAASVLRAREGNGLIRVACRSSAAGLELTVSDNGPGIPERELPRLFTPFVTKRRSGTGFGLAIVKQIAEAHQGSIEVESDERGTTFTLRFPPPPSQA